MGLHIAGGGELERGIANDYIDYFPNYFNKNYSTKVCTAQEYEERTP